MNKTEKRYADYLEIRKKAGEILEYRFEPFKIRLAASTFYTPDFMVVLGAVVVGGCTINTVRVGLDADEWTADELIAIELHEVKTEWKGRGVHWEDDARVKIKVAAEMYPWFVWKSVADTREGWKVEEF